MPHRNVPQPIVRAIDAQLALDVLGVFAASLTESEILASQVLDDEGEPGRHTFEHPTAKDGRGRPLRIDLRLLEAHRAQGRTDGFPATNFGIDV